MSETNLILKILGNNQVQAFPAPEKAITILFESIADDIIDGKYGNGDARIRNLKNIGFDDSDIHKIQSIVNRKMKG